MLVIFRVVVMMFFFVVMVMVMVFFGAQRLYAVHHLYDLNVGIHTHEYFINPGIAFAACADKDIRFGNSNDLLCGRLKGMAVLTA